MNTYVGYLFSESKILFTVILNFLWVAYFYVLITQGMDAFYVSEIWVGTIGLGITGILISYLVASYKDWKLISKK